MFHVGLVAQGGLAIGVGAFGNAVWAQRQPHCHRWSIWRTRTPKAPAPCGDDWGFGTNGVREPRRPFPQGGAGTIALDMPDGD
jgi:hypothetical protein